ncbi:hypothetical protein MNBD_BACTEROID01-170 [hydrothermal vent metagenome]|uniref:DUF4249 domain-containing protein n=1 Tax=hydrothermal vent metagenome TaxID=652676 RepID=A0A3B0T286_9ZZZZ
MKFIFQITILFIILFILGGCIKNIDLGLPDTGEIIGVECFFTVDSCWKVKVYPTFNINDKNNRENIKNAKVIIYGEDNSPVYLTYQQDGYYFSEQKPKAGIIYNLWISIEGKDIITATSRVPEQSELSEIEMNFSPQSFVTQYSVEQDMISASFKIAPITKNIYCRLRILKFDEANGYNKYSFDEGSYDRMISMGVDTMVIKQLLPLRNKILFGNLWYILSYYIGEVKAGELLSVIKEISFVGTINYRHPDAFRMARSITTQGIFYQPMFETYTHLGIIPEKVLVKVYFDPFEAGESWLEYLDISEEFYKFQKDYMLQLSNRGNINASPVLVYNNIENGVGIFAGYRRQLFHLTKNK